MSYLVHEALEVVTRRSVFRKIPNILLSLASYGLSSLLRRQILWGYPFMMMIEPTNICNLKCPMCVTGNGTMVRPNGFMSLEQFRELIDEVGNHLLHLTLWSQGEPFINRSFNDMVRYASDKGIATLTSSNGHFLKDSDAIVESGLSDLIISIDGATQETYEQYRVGGKLDRVIDGILGLTEAKKRLKKRTPRIELQFLIMKHNEHEIGTIKQLAKDLEVDRLSLKTVQVYSNEQAAEFLPSREEYSRYVIDQEGNFEMKVPIHNRCRWVWLCPTLNWDGTVSPCCFDKNADYPLGNVFEDGGMKKIWKSDRYRDFRMQIFRDRRAIDICTNCSEGLGVLVHAKEAITS